MMRRMKGLLPLLLLWRGADWVAGAPSYSSAVFPAAGGSFASERHIVATRNCGMGHVACGRVATSTTRSTHTPRVLVLGRC